MKTRPFYRTHSHLTPRLDAPICRGVFFTQIVFMDKVYYVSGNNIDLVSIITMSEKISDDKKALLKQEFIEGFVDEKGVRVYAALDIIGKRNNIARSTIYRIAQNENWQNDKNLFHQALEDELRESRRKQFVKEGRKLDERSLSIASDLLSSVENRLKGFTELKAYELKELGLTAATAQKIGKLALGEAQEINKVATDANTPESFIRIMEELDKIRIERSQRSNHLYN